MQRTYSSPVALEFNLGFVFRMYTIPCVRVFVSALELIDTERGNHMAVQRTARTHCYTGGWSPLVSRHSLEAQMPIRSVHIREYPSGIGEQWVGVRR